MTCEGCSVPRQEKNGCKPGTLAKRPLVYAKVPGIQLNRCPLATVRDQSGAARVLTQWVKRWMLASQAGNLAAYLQSPTLRVLDLIDHGLEVRAAMSREG